MEFNFNHYDIIELKDITLLVSNCGAIKISSKKLVCALKDIKLLAPAKFNHDSLNQIIKKNNLPIATTRDFLKNAINLKSKIETGYYKKTLLIHDWPEPNELEDIISEELNSPYEFCYNEEALAKKAKNENQFIMIICTRYDYNRLKNAYFTLAKASPSSAFSVSFLNGNLFHIGQPYTKNIGNPCHFCIIDRKLNYEKRSSSKNSWSSLLKFCCDQGIATPSQRLNRLQRNLIIGATIHQIKRYTDENSPPRYQDDVISSMTINLDTGALIDEVIPHWHTCDCLRP